jgi:hypothetical protein
VRIFSKKKYSQEKIKDQICKITNHAKNFEMIEEKISGFNKSNTRKILVKRKIVPICDQQKITPKISNISNIVKYFIL